MPKFGFINVLILLLLISGCAVQATPVELTITPTREPLPTNTPTAAPTVEIPPTQTSPAAISLADQYPMIVPSSDLFSPVVSTDPGDSQRLAYCAPGEIRISQDAGQTWETISTAGVDAAIEGSGYELFYGEPGSQDACLSVTLDPNHPQTFYAVFTTAFVEFGAPPVFYMGFFTTNGGETWQLVEYPENASLESFGGFWNLGADAVQTQFFPAESWDLEPDEILITETVNGGGDWQPGDLSCPSNGPCLRWGPAPSNVPGMGSPLPQPIYFSPDSGETWSEIDPPVELRAPAPNQLVMLSDSQALIISGAINLSAESAAVRNSLDGGASWQPVALPALSSEETIANYFPGLQYLPNHTYIAQGPEESSWYWLQPEMPIWCPVNTDRLPSYPVLLQNVGDQVWWVDPQTQAADHFPLSDLTCATE